MLAPRSIQWINMNTTTQNEIRNCPTCLGYQATLESVGGDTFIINNKHDLYIAHYHRKFPIKKQVKELSTDDLIKTSKIIFSEYGLPNKMHAENLFQKHLRTSAKGLVFCV